MRKSNMRAIHKWFIIDLSGWALIALICLAISSCSPQKRLNRLIKNNPELAKTDTSFKTIEKDIPGYRIDTNVMASMDVSGLNEILEHYKDFLDSMKRVKLQSQLTTYITNRSCLIDTLKIQLVNNGWCKLWQSGNIFYYQLNQPAKKIMFTVPVRVNSFDVTIKKRQWSMFWLGAFVATLLIIILMWLGSFLKPIRI